MPSPLPVEIRDRVVRVVEDEGLTIEAAAARFKIGTASVKRWLRRSRVRGTVEPSTMGGVRFIWVPLSDKAKLVDLVEVMTDATIEELAVAYNARHGTEISRSAMMRALQRCDITRKKSHSAPRKRSQHVSPMPATDSQSSSKSSTSRTSSSSTKRASIRR